MRTLLRTALIGLVGLALTTGTVWAFDFTQLMEKVSTHTLDNGLRIIVMEDHDAPVISFITFVNVGGVNDPKDYTGLAHMFEHMAFKGTSTIGSTDFAKELKAMKVEDSIWAELREERKKGRFADSTRLVTLETDFAAAIEAAREFVVPNAFDQVFEREGVVGLNAGTRMDFTTYDMNLPSNRLELWMALESERFYDPVLREMYMERDVITEERRQVVENDPFRRMMTEVASTAYTAHPYGVPIIGHMSDIKGYSREAALAYYKKYYVPSNMIISLVGDVDPKQAFKLAEKYWGRIPAKPKPEELNTVEPPQEGMRRVMLEDPAQPMFACAWHIPAETHPDYVVIEALCDYLGQGRTSQLYKSMVEEKKAAAVVATFPGYIGSKYPTLAWAIAIPTPSSSNEECEKLIMAEVEKMRTELIPEAEVEKIKARAKAAFISQLSSSHGMAIQLAWFENTWGSWRHLFKQIDLINNVTAEDIKRVANEYLVDKNLNVVHLNTMGS